MNIVILCGNVCDDPKMSVVNNEAQTPIAKYVLAVNRYQRKTGERITRFIPITAFGPRAEFAEKNIKKGMRLLINGELDISNYTDANGNRRMSTDVIASAQEIQSRKERPADAASGDEAVGPDADMPTPEFLEMDEDFPMP